eukprot:6013121-Amphidinium_carterae.1
MESSSCVAHPDGADCADCVLACFACCSCAQNIGPGIHFWRPTDYIFFVLSAQKFLVRDLRDLRIFDL